jgi:hypothetical protein
LLPLFQAAQPGINTLSDVGKVASYDQYPKHSWTNIDGTPQSVEPASQVNSQVQQAEQQLGPNQKQQLQQLQQQQEQQQQQQEQQQQQQGRKLQQAQARHPASPYERTPSLGMRGFLRLACSVRFASVALPASGEQLFVAREPSLASA